MNEGENKEIIDVLKRIEKQLVDINFELGDIKKQMPKVPFYGDLLKDIVSAIENTRM